MRLVSVLHNKVSRFVVAAMALMAASPILLSVIPAAPAYAECNPNRTDDDAFYHIAMFQHRGGNFDAHGVRSNIIVEDTYVKPGSSHFAAAWTMLTQLSHLSWLQVGWWEYDDNERHTFAQVNQPGEFYTNFYPPEDVGTLHSYKTEYQPPVGIFPAVFGFFVDTVQVHQGVATFAPTELQAAEEINTRASQMPGDSGSPEHLQAIMIKWEDTDYTPMAGAMINADTAIFGHTKVSASHFDGWDKAC